MEKARATWIVAGLVAAHVVLHGVALLAIVGGLWPNYTYSPRYIALYSLFTLGPSQGTLLAIWVVLGGGKFLWRALSTALGTILYVWWFSFAHDHSSREWLVTTLATMCVSAASLLLARWTGLRLERSCDSRPASGPFQFYIRDMLLWTTATAIVLSGWRCLPKSALDFLQNAVPVVAFVGLGLIGAVSMFFALGRRWIVARILLLPIAVVLTAKFLNASIPGAAPSWYFALLFSLMVFWIVGSLLVLRFVGYRLAWRRRLEQSQENIAA